MTIYGVDLSSVQGSISSSDWQSMKASGIEFIINQAYVGNDGASSTYAEYKAGAEAVGILNIPYAFLYPIGLASTTQNPARDGRSQAELHYSFLQSPCAIDLEWPVSSADMTTYGCSPSQIVDWVNLYQETYKGLSGAYCLLYSYPDYISMLGNPASFSVYDLWIASYEPTPTIPAPWSQFSVWQYSGGGGKLPSGAPVDQDCVSSLDVFAPWLPKPAAPSTPIASVPSVNTAPSSAQSSPAPTLPTSSSFWNSLAGLLKRFWV